MTFKALDYSDSPLEQHTFPSIYHFSKHNIKLKLSNLKKHKALRKNQRHLDGFERHSYGYIMVFKGKTWGNTENIGYRDGGKWIYTGYLMEKKRTPNPQYCMIYFKLNELNSLIK